jgi:ABC-type amino acid transport substrate-binding protein
VWIKKIIVQIIFLNMIFILSSNKTTKDFDIVLAKKEKVVKIATLECYEPFCFVKDYPSDKIEEIIRPGLDSQRLQGYSWDIIREVFHSQGYTIDLRIVPWARGLKYTESGKTDLLFPTGKNDERLRIFDYSTETVNEVNFVFYVNKDSILKWEGLDKMNNISVSILRGWNYGSIFSNHNGFRKEESSEDIISCFHKLKLKRVDAVVGYEIVYDYELKKHNMMNDFKKFPPFDSAKEYVVGQKGTLKTKELLKIYDQGKKLLILNGKLKKLSKKWQ